MKASRKKQNWLNADLVFEGLVEALSKYKITSSKRAAGSKSIALRVLFSAASTQPCWPGICSEEADDPECHETEETEVSDQEYHPDQMDRRAVVDRQIRERRGQRQFRDGLRERYGNRCLVTGCAILAVLEAAHISPYRGENDNHPENGLLLRSDVHTLFDLDLLGIEPEGLRVELHPDVAKEYERTVGLTLGCAGHHRPSREALILRYERFRERLKYPV